MFLSRITILICLYFLSIQNLYGQSSQIFESILEQVEEESTEQTGWLEYLWELKEKPLNINKVSTKELVRIPFISPIVAKNIIKYREENGSIKHLEEIRKIDGITEELFEIVQIFITVDSPFFDPKFIYRFQTRLESPARLGYINGQYNNPFYFQHRFLFDVNQSISGGFLWEKDAGEREYFDFGSFFVQYSNPDKKFSILTGDYQIRIGTGLALWSPYGIPLTPYALPLLPETGLPLVHNRSTNEVGYLRGVALDFNTLRNIGINFFYSNNKLSANLHSNGESITSVFTSGLHRTETERNKVGVFREEIYGFSVRTQLNFLFLQISGFQNRHSPQYKNYGNIYNNISLSYMFTNGAIQPMGEFALYKGKFTALNQYFYLKHNKFRYQLVFHYYHPEYFALRGRAFGAFNSIPQNQVGSAFILYYLFSPLTKLAGYFYINRKIRESNSDLFIKRNFYIELTQKYEVQLLKVQYRRYYRANDVISSEMFQKIIHGIRLDHSVNVTRKMLLKNRLEMRWAKPLKTNKRYYGLNFFIQMDWSNLNNFKMITRWSTFDIPDYDLRIYEYEFDLPGNFRSVLLNGRGYKWIYLVRFKLSKKIQLDFKYQHRFYPDQTSIGSGLDTIEKNRVNDFRLSFIWRY